ncbi:hypothetical protein MNBD_GAMMA10-649, partial [hydrothermal vent metagenome]
MVILTIALGASVNLIAQYIPFEFETAIAESAVKNIKDAHNEVDEYLQALADKLIVEMDLPENMKIHLHYANEDTVNAMSTLGGHIIVYRGLLEKLPDENALVMLLGHEMGHVKLRHPVKGLGQAIVFSLLMSVILGESSDSVANVITDSSVLTMMSFSRDQEEDSDDMGINLVNAYYGHTQGALGLFEALQEQQQASSVYSPEFLNSHPDTESRIKRLHQLIEKQHWEQQGKVRLIPENIIKKLKAD